MHITDNKEPAEKHNKRCDATTSTPLHTPSLTLTNFHPATFKHRANAYLL
eukprot:m.23093 g.23093  ORF g.23093 m.23093 type:complete len:50 (+) comp8450_c0_seq1:95-244(+)